MANRRPVNRKHLSRLEREEHLRRWMIIGAAAVFAVVLLVLGLGFYQQYVVQPKRPVATVNGQSVALEDYQKRVQYRRQDYQTYLASLQSQRQQFAASQDEQQDLLLQYFDQQISQIQSELASIGTVVLDEMIDEAIVRQECARRGISVSDAEVQSELESQFGYDPNPPTPVPVTATETMTVTPTPTTAPMTEAEFEQSSSAFFQQIREQTGFAEQDFRELLRTSLLRQQLEAEISAEVPTTAEQVRARHILVETREEAEQVLSKLEQGGDFVELAQEYSTDTGSKESGGDLGWFAHDAMVEPFSEAAFALEPGETSGIVESEYGFHIIRVEDHAAERELDSSALDQRQQAAVQEWFEEQRNSEDIERKWNSSMVPTPIPTKST